MEDGKEVYHKEKDPPLSDYIEHIYPDYSLYPQYTGYGKSLKQQTAYGFLTRGCPRGCSFCHVAGKECKRSIKVADLSEFWRGQGSICLSDPNILACKDSESLLQQLIESKAYVELNQGIDARLITEHTATLLTDIKLKNPHFAMDTMQSMEPVKKGLKLYQEAVIRKKGKMNWRQGTVFMLTNFDTSFEQDMERVKAIQECGFRPYVMIYNKPSASQKLKRLQRWTNNVYVYAKCKTFEEYQKHYFGEIIY